MFASKDIDVLILCGGLGKRLKRIVSGRPKPMVDINGEPFLDYILKHISSFGFERFILCTGYKSDFIANYYKNKIKNSLEIVISKEKGPLGTGGAVKKARCLIRSKRFLAVNGDSLCEVNLDNFLNFHLRNNALASIVVRKSKKTSEYGSINLNKFNQIVKFSEKSVLNKTNFISTGVYFFEKDIFKYMPKQNNFSLEYDFFPKITNKGLYGFKFNGFFIDIGIPIRYKKATSYFKNKIQRERR